jgi:hypothetical protein
MLRDGSRGFLDKELTGSVRVLVVAPGASTSTYDVFKYTLDSMKELSQVGKVSGFYMHNSFMYHSIALAFAMPESTQEIVNSSAVSRSAYDVFTTVYVEKPDVVHFIDGTMVPIDLFRFLQSMREETGRRFVISVHLTEEPYATDYAMEIAKFSDVLFVNDVNSLSVFDPSDSKHVYYAPNAYMDSVHYPDYSVSRTGADVFMCGTMYPERLEFLRQVD